MKENIYTDCNYTLDMNASHYNINRASPLPPGEGQGEGVKIQAVSLILSPVPRFNLPNSLGFVILRRSTTYIPVGVPEGEGVCGTAVGVRCLMAYNAGIDYLLTE